MGSAARYAYDNVCSEWGNGVGPQGQCYAIPTMHGPLSEIKHLPSTIFTKLLFKYLATKTDKTFLILRSEELWKERIGEELWGQLDDNGRIITKGHKGMSQHITRGNIKKDNGYDKLITILKKYEQKQN